MVVLTQNIDENIPGIGLANAIIGGASVVSNCVTVDMHHFQYAVCNVLFSVGHDIVLAKFPNPRHNVNEQRGKTKTKNKSATTNRTRNKKNECNE